VEQAGAPWDIYYRPRTAFLADFVGSVNLVPAKVLDVSDDAVTIAVGSQRASVRRPEGVALSAGQEVKLCLRPESFAIGPSTGSASDGRGFALDGTIVRRAFLGDTMRYWVKVEDREWIVDQPDPGGSATLEGPVSVALRPDRVHVIAE
jgi:ABC-type Fe3+/spermidine/putrescine transport system ATPase subunit